MSIRFMSALSLVAFGAATLAADIAARVIIGGEGAAYAATDHLSLAVTNPIGTLLLFAPFGLLALIAAYAMDRTDRGIGLALFAIHALILVAVYAYGFFSKEQAFADERWTAGALSIAFLPFAALLVLIIAGLVAYAAVMARR